jgi:hypothetical protein
MSDNEGRVAAIRQAIRLYNAELRKLLPPKDRDSREWARYRVMLRNWHCTVPVEFNPGIITKQRVIDMANYAGFHCGICEWRPFSKKAKNGSYGMFRVASTSEELALFVSR